MGRGRSSSGGGSRGFSSSSGSRGISRSSSRSSYSHRSRRSHSGTHISIHGGGHSGSIIPIMVGAVFVFVSIFIAILGIVRCFSGKDYGTVNAKCIQNDYIGGWYYTTYEYTVEGIDYTNRSQEGWEKPEENIGGIIEIYYLKEDPNIITERSPGTIGEGLMFVGFGLLFGGIGAVMLVISIKSYKREQRNQPIPISMKSTNSLETKTCAYCGSQYSASSKNCPHCGANRNK